MAPRELGRFCLGLNVGRSYPPLVHGFTLTADDRRLLIAAAAGAGFAGIYIAPITGMLFAVEILHKNVSKRSVAVSLTMSTIAMWGGIQSTVPPILLCT